MKVLGRITLALVLIALTALPVMAQATVVHEQGQENYEYNGSFLCLDEEPWVDHAWVDGPRRWVSHITLDSAGGFSMNYHETFQFSGVSDITGYRYAGHWVKNEHQSGRVGEVYNWVWPVVVRNLDTHEVAVSDFQMHVTVNANGVVTVDRSDFAVRCPGQ
ncbi:MAG: hypothetical protein H6646_06760 [Anaerolineales bacterium]|nr:hypothetical protein [Anaerolineales bacterium]